MESYLSALSSSVRFFLSEYGIVSRPVAISFPLLLRALLNSSSASSSLGPLCASVLLRSLSICFLSCRVFRLHCMNHPSKTLPFFSLVFHLALLVSSELGFISLSLLVQLPELCQCCFSTEFVTETFPFSFFCLLCYLLELLGFGIHCRCECWVWVWMDVRCPDSRKEAWQILLI